MFFIDYFGQQVKAFPLNDIPRDFAMHFGTRSFGEMSVESIVKPEVILKTPVAFSTYMSAHQTVQDEMLKGNTYLLNLTFPTEIELTGSLVDVFEYGTAPYRAIWRNHFCCFSPESFVTIVDNRISTTPVKGTSAVDQDLDGQLLLNNPKERAEHEMVVDLLRNDLAQVATDVEVKHFRYLQQIQTDRGSLWQTESLIEGAMQPEWPSQVGEILKKILPAGSVTGMPKHETCQIIERVEPVPRGYYCGIFGYYQDHALYTAVSIRFIAQKGEAFYYHSGGGLTIDSEAKAEYKEMLLKVYLSGGA